jgi:hypothetical protein
MLRSLQNAAWFAAFACLVLGFVIFVWSASQEPSRPQKHSEYRSNQSNKNNQISNAGDQNSTPNSALTNPIINYLKGYAAYCVEKPKAEQDKWRYNFWCEIKIGEAVIAAFTLLVAIVTSLLVAVGVGQGVVMLRTIMHSRQADRAHVSGGANHGTKNGSHVLIVTINNLGRTQAFIGTVAATICKERELAIFPGWATQQWKGYMFGRIAGCQTNVFLPYETGKVIVGRIWYRDIFKKHHSVGFVLKTDDLSAVGGRSASVHWEERPEKNLGPAEPKA